MPEGRSPEAEAPMDRRARATKASGQEQESGYGSKSTLGSVSRSDARRPPQRESLSELNGVDLVVAESLKTCLVAYSSRVPSHRIWALALPKHRMAAASRDTVADEISRIAKRFGGLLTDSDLARESIERVVQDRRPRIAIFPPIALDRVCPKCGDHTVADGGTPADLDPTVGQLVTWRALGERLRASGRICIPFSYLAARLLGISGPWEPTDRRTWEGAPVQEITLGPPLSMAPHWSAHKQEQAARAVLDATVSAVRHRPVRSVLVAGYDLKFAVDLAERLHRRSDLNVTVDEWPAVSRGGEHSEALADEAQSIFAEWARPSAVWYSQRKRPDQLLVVRLHRFELDAPYPYSIVADNVDAMVYIAPLFGKRIRDELSWPVEKLVYIPNYVDIDWLERPKLPDARFALGFVGIERSIKRFDLALDLLASVRQEDQRFCLFVRSVLPWNNRSTWSDANEREFAEWCQERIDWDPLLRGAVHFDAPGRDMARWYRKVGHIVSSSDAEGVHTSVAEGMASGAVPVIRPWPGADDIYGKEWIYHSLDLAAAAVIESVDELQWMERSARARAEIRRSHDPRLVEAAWADLLHGDVKLARRHFADYTLV